MKKILFLFLFTSCFCITSTAQNHWLGFDGNDWVDCGNNPMLNPGNGSFTVEFWARRDFNAGGMHPITKGYYQASPAGGYGWNFRCNQGDKRMYMQVGSGNWASAIETVRSDDGLWHHFAGVIDRVNNLVVLYKDGVFQNSSSISSIGFIGIPDPMFIGKSLNFGYGEEPWVGQIDEVRVWNTARTQTQIQQNMYQYIQNPVFEPI